MVLALLLCFGSTIAQVPQAFNYQGIARDGSGTPLTNANISLRITLLEGTLPGIEVYKENHYVQTTKLGIFNLEIGHGTSAIGDFANINWGSGNHFVRVEMDPEGGNNFITLGESQLLSVPYALYAGNGNSQWQNNPDGIHYNAGNVGIGDGLPQNNLSIQSNIPDGDERWFLTMHNQSISSRSFVSMKLSAGDQNSQTDLTHHAASYNYDGDKFRDFGQLRSTGRGLILRSDANNSAIKFLVGNTGGLTFLERMRITANGKVGIGTENPQSNLSIEGSDNNGSDINYLTLHNTSLGDRSGVAILLSAGDDQSITTLGHHSETYTFDGDKFTDFGQVRSTGRGLILRSDANNSVIKFLVGNTGGQTFLERMRVTSTGNVGIGTEDPASKLQITNGDVFIENINNGVIMKSPDGNCWRVTVQNDGSLKTIAISCPN